MNIFGERQHPEKFVPMVIRKVLNGETVTIHANKTKTKAGTRFYLHARNLSSALLHIINLGYHGYDEWNIAGLEEVDNLTLAKLIAEYVGKELKYEMVDFHSSRPGHDLRYALDSTKLIGSGYVYPKGFRESLKKTVEWTLNRRGEWL
jgi:dTDP-glucose 4,6-dehydratase